MSLASRFRRFDKGGSISGTVAVNFAAAALSALTSVIFARILGITDYGLYVYVISITGFVGSLARLGLPTLITRQVAAWAVAEEWQLYNGIIFFGIFATLSSSVLLASLLLAFHRSFGQISTSPGFFAALCLGAGVMVLQCIDSTIAGALQGMHFIARSLLPQSIILPSALIIFVLSTHIIHRKPTAVMLLAAQFCMGLLVETYQVRNLLRTRPGASRGQGYRMDHTQWLLRSLPFWGNGILFIINIQADTLLLGYFSGGRSAAIYTVGTRGAQLVVLTLGAIVTAIQPRISALHSSGDHAGVARVVTHTTRLGFVIAVASATFFLVSARTLIRLLYGPSYVAAATVLLILVFARVVNASVGSLGPYLAMTGKEYLLLKALGAESVANVLLNIVLIPRWGLNGSAFATGVSMAATNILLALYVYKRWGVDVSIIGLASPSEAVL